MFILALEEVEQLAKLERVQALLDMSEDEYENLDPQEKEEFDKFQHNQSMEKKKESVL